MLDVADAKSERSGKTPHRTLRAAVWVLLFLAVVGAIVIGSGMLSEDAAFNLSSLLYVVVPIGAGAVVMCGAMVLESRSRVAWLMIGAGVFAWGMGELIWVTYEFFLHLEVPYPGIADIFYVLGYPVIFAGVLLLPHVKPRPLERVRLTIDALAGTIAISAVMWVTYLGDQIYFDPEVGLLEQFINIMYPFGDVILLVGLMILTVRKSANRYDVRLFALAVGMVVTAAADALYILQIEAEAYVSGGWLDALWLLAYGAFALAGWYLLRPARRTEQVERSARVWQLAAPYAAISLLFALTLWDIGGNVSTLQIASTVVGLLIIGRQGVAIRENRELVEHQRDDLIASISHELRTPLTGVTGFTALLNSEWDSLGDAERTEMISIVDAQAQHVNRIVTDLVGIARGSLHSTSLSVAAHDLDLLVRDAVAMVPELTDDDAGFDLDIESGLEITADRGRVMQVLVNLLTNAVRYGGGRTLLKVHTNDHSVVFEVHDSGRGVPKRYEQAIWARFERGAHHLDAKVPGSGIGLPIAKSLVEAHRGTIEYERSALLGGSSFVVALPYLRTLTRALVD